MNSKLRVFLFLSFLLFLILYFRNQKEPILQEPKKESTKSPVLLKQEIVSPQGKPSNKPTSNLGHKSKNHASIKKQIEISPLSKNKKKKHEFNPNTEIHFKVVEGYAIASEDLILGKPKDPDQKPGATPWTSDEIQIWDSAELTYAFDSNLPEALKQRIQEALDSFARKTSFKFFPYTGNEKDFVVFSKSENLCASYVGKVGGAQPILVNPNCGVSEIKHEVMHALGFIHEHQREIRDQHLDVFLQNVQEEKLVNFDILPRPFQRIYKSVHNDIDFKSLMLYPSNAFVMRSDLNSIMVKNSNTKISENADLSDGDMEKINNLYFRKF